MFEFYRFVYKKKADSVLADPGGDVLPDPMGLFKADPSLPHLRVPPCGVSVAHACRPVVAGGGSVSHCLEDAV